MPTKRERLEAAVGGLAIGEEVSVRSLARDIGMAREDALKELDALRKEGRAEFDGVHNTVKRLERR